MSDTRADLPFWQMVAGVAGTFLAAFFVGVGRRAGALARRAPDAAPTGDALQREILDQGRRSAEAALALAGEMRGLRSDWQAKRDADEARRRDQRDGLDERLDDIVHALGIGRRADTEIKVLLRELIDRQPYRGAAPGPDRDVGRE